MRNVVEVRVTDLPELNQQLDEMRAQIAALSSWQPIATAPKDGSRFLGGWRHGQYGWLWGSCRFYTDNFFPDGYFAMEGGGAPTHWIPLPEPPK